MFESKVDVVSSSETVLNPDPIVAGGYALNRILASAKTKDLDIFTTDDPEYILGAFGYKPSMRSEKVARCDEHGIEVIQMDVPEDQMLVECVLSSFDFGIIQVAYDPVSEEVFVTDLWQEHAYEGLLELDPNIDLQRNPNRTGYRASRLVSKLHWQLGPRLTEFIQERGLEDFKPVVPIPEAQVFQVVKESRTIFVYETMAEVRSLINPSMGPQHILEVAYASQKASISLE